MKNKLTTLTLTQNELDHLLYVLETDLITDMYEHSSSCWKSSLNKKTKKLIEEIKLQTIWSKVIV